MSIPHILADVQRTPWAILPSKLDEIMAFLRLADVGALPEQHAAQPVRQMQHSGTVAVIPIFGAIVPRANMLTEFSGGTSAELLRRDIMTAANDPAVSAIVLDIDSPGGSVRGTAEVAQAVAAAAQTKTVIAVANTMAASAAYWIASQATELVASPSADVGSIGIVVALIDSSRAETEAGIDTTIITSGKYKSIGHGPIDDAQRAVLQEWADSSYDDFVSAVASGRHVTDEVVRSGFGDGFVVGSRRALELGMVDRIATLDEVLQGFVSPQGITTSRAAAGVAEQDQAQANAVDRERLLRRISFEERITQRKGNSS